jgi:hypothetical protein
MKPHQATAVSVPAQWMGPVGSRSAGPLWLRIPGVSGVMQPVLKGSVAQSFSTYPTVSKAFF